MQRVHGVKKCRGLRDADSQVLQGVQGSRGAGAQAVKRVKGAEAQVVQRVKGYRGLRDAESPGMQDCNM